MKMMLVEQYAGDSHYVWCSDCFDSSKAGAYTARGNAAPSSDPASIYRQLVADVKKNDKHSQKIADQRLSLISRGSAWCNEGLISAEDAEEITYFVNSAEISHFRPLIFVIPYAAVAERVRVVPMQQRASFGREYIISDLKRHEFEIIEI